MNTAEKFVNQKDSFGVGMPLEEELVKHGAIVIDSSSWVEANHSSEPWNIWEFMDNSKLFVKGSSRFPYIRSY